MGDINLRRDKVALPLFPSPSSPARFLFRSPQSPHDTKRSLRRGEPLYYTFFRLIAHSEDPDIDKPYQPPVGHVLGASK